MLTIAKTYEMQATKDLGKATAQASSSNPPCKGYMKHRGEFVGTFAGGEQFQLLKDLAVIGNLFAYMAKTSLCRPFSISLATAQAAAFPGYPQALQPI